MKFICLKVLKNESLNYKITCEKVNPKANSLKHTTQNVCGDINAVVVIYNQIIDSLIEKLVKYIKTGVLLDTSYFEEQYMQIKKSSISPLYLLSTCY